MNDTPKFIQKKQFEIIASKPLKDRLNGLFEMTELSRKIIRNRIRTKTPDISEIELRIEMFKTFYRSDYDKEALQIIAEQMAYYLENEKKE